VRNHFAISPLECFGCLQLCSWFTITPLEISQSKQCSSGQGGRRSRPDSGDLVGGLGRGSSWGGSRSCGEPTWVLTHSGETTGVGCGGDRRRPPLGALLRQVGGSAWSTSGRGSFVGARGRREWHVLALQVVRG
jgi:hypothetical protein